ncbi:MAG TPA: DUF1761 domain-containing protein [Candidatus Sulfotelmatobacter sp.]|nr:DUF1761 domain-containing protein [Candidatus Sulfotelmatobacter sp.]
MGVEVNYLAVFLAGVVAMILGFLWYSPLVLGKPWMKEKGYTQESLKKAQKEMGMLYGLSFVVGLVTAYVLFHVTVLSGAFFHYPKLETGLTSAFWMWLGFMMPVGLTATIFGNKNWKLFGIDTGYQLVSVLGMGLVIGLL